jgi:hypothetical protein
MSILNVDKIQPIGSGSTVTVNATDTILTNAQAGVITATRFDGIISATTDDWITHQGDSNTKFGFPAADQFQVYVAGAPKITATSTEITAAVQVNIESAGSYIKSNQLKFNPNGDAFIDHGVTSKDITFRLSNSSALDFNAIKIDSSAQQTKFGKQIVVGLQGGNDVTTIGGGSGIGAYIQLEHASSGTNSKLMGNNNSWLNAYHGTLGIGTISAAAKLDVYGSGSSSVIRGRRTDSNGGYNIFEGYSDINGANVFTVSNNGVGYFKGNVSLAVGSGIDFTAQTASSASGVTVNNETLDHFEEGTWTPTQATLGSWASGAEIDGKYQRVGNWVTASFIVKYASNGSGHAASIDGLPYANNNSGSSYKQGGFVSYSNNSNVSSFLIENGGSRIYIYTNAGATIQLTSMDNIEVRGTVIYRVA